MHLFRAQPRAAIVLTGLYLASNAYAQQPPGPTNAPDDEDDGNNSGPGSGDNSGLPPLSGPSNNNDDDDQPPQTAPPPASTNRGPPAGTTNPPAQPTNDNNDDDDDDDENTESEQQDQTKLQDDDQFTNPGTATITGNNGGTNIVTFDATRITGGPSATKGGGLTGLPKIPGMFTIMPAQVPPTRNAPYMQASNAPQGTVFIAVGAILGAFLLGLLIWRGVTTWMLQRNVKKASEKAGGQDTKKLLNFRAPDVPMGMYKYSDRDKESTLSLAKLAKSPNKSGRPNTAGGGPPGAAPGQSMFFSPTAAGAGGTSLLNPAGQRGSAYLPSGYYAAGSALPGSGTGMAHIGGSGANLGLNSLAPQMAGYSRTRSMGTTPPDSPGMGAVDRRMQEGVVSTSTLDLNRTQGRAPSAYLEDLFDQDPGLFPGQGAPMPPPHGGRY